MEKQENIIATYQQIIQETETTTKSAETHSLYQPSETDLIRRSSSLRHYFLVRRMVKTHRTYRTSHHRFHLAGAKPQPMVLLERLSQKENRNQSAGTTSTAI